MKIRNVAFFLIFLLLMVIVELVDEVWLSQVLVRSSDIFPSWVSSPDSALFIFINQSFGNQLLDLIMSLVTHTGSTIFWLIIVLVLWFTDRKKEAILLATAIILGGIFFLVLKVFITRPRPYQIIAGSRVLEVEGGSSFPSGHAKNVFSAAAILSKDRRKKWRVSLYLLAVIVSFSRIYVGMHYPLDVLVGALAGYIIAKIALLYEKQLISLAKKFNHLSNTIHTSAETRVVNDFQRLCMDKMLNPASRQKTLT